MNYLPINFKQYSEIYSRKIKNIQEYFKTNFDVEVYIVYGTMLGAIRDNHFITHDDDIDLAYLSKKNNIVEVKKELDEIYRKLEKDGLLIKDFNKLGQCHIYCPDKSILVDLWTSWVDDADKYYLIPLFNGTITKENIFPFKNHTFLGEELLIPNNPDAILKECYGNWRTPSKSKPMHRNIWL